MKLWGVAILVLLLVALTLVHSASLAAAPVSPSYRSGAVYRGVAAVVPASDGSVAAVLGNGSVVDACSGSIVGSVSLSGVDASSIVDGFYSRNTGVLALVLFNGTHYIVESRDARGVIGSPLVMGALGRSGSPWLFEAVPCRDARCVAVLYGEGNASFAGLYLFENGSMVRSFRSNSVLLQVVNGSIVASTFDRYNDSVVVDLLSGRSLYLFPATRPLRMFGLPLLQLVLSNNSLWGHIILVKGGGVEAFVAKPGDARFYEAPPTLASSLDLSFYTVGVASNFTVVAFPDGYAFSSPVMLAPIFSGAFWHLQKAEGVLGVDVGRHWALVRVFENMSAALEVVAGNWSRRVVLAEASPGDVYRLRGFMCHGSLDRVVVWRGDTARLLVLAGSSASGGRAQPGSARLPPRGGGGGFEAARLALVAGAVIGAGVVAVVTLRRDRPGLGGGEE